MATFNSDIDTRVRVWIDCDPGHDDAFSLLLATHSPEIEVIGISIVHGNDTVEHCGLNAKRFLWTCGISGIPVYLGAERPLLRSPKFCPEIHGISGEQGVSGLCGFHFPDKEIFSNPANKINKGHGVIKMKEALIASPKKVTIVATGAQTNLALLLRMFPEVVTNIERIVFMGGAIGIGNTGVGAEFNIEIDPEAAHIVFHSGVPLVMIPLEVTHTILATEEVLNRIRNIGDSNSEDSFLLVPTTSPRNPNHGRHVEYDEITRVVNLAKKFGESPSTESETEFKKEASSAFASCCYNLLTFFKTAYREVFAFHSGPPLHDPCTIFYITNPEAFETLHVFVDVETLSQKCVGRTLVDLHGILKKEPNMLLCTRVDAEKFWQKMFVCMVSANSKSPLNKHY